MSDDESIDESEQQTEEQPADSDRAAEQSEEQPADGDQQSAQSDDGPADNDQPADQSNEQPAEETDQPEQQTDHQPAEDQLEPLRGEPMDEAMRNKLELDLESADVTPATAKTGDCSSWENDPRGFAKAIADNYLSTEFDHMPGVVAPEGMSCWSSRPGGKVSDFCYLHYSDGWNVIVSLGNIPDYVKARAIAPERKPMCTYSYDCTDTGVLVFTRRGCYA